MANVAVPTHTWNRDTTGSMEHEPRRILLADHDRDRLVSLRERLERLGHAVTITRDPLETLEALADWRPDLVVLAPLSPSPGGPEIQRIAEVKDRHRLTPLVLVTDAPLAAEQARQLARRIDDVVTLDDGSGDELWTRIELALGRLALVRELEEEKLSLERQSITDFKTGTYNDRYFHRRLREEFERARRHRQALACLMLDFDNFKEINDTFDHVFGDFVLLAFAKKMRSVVRSIDIPARLGGDEFVVLLPNTGLDEAVTIAERLRRIVSDYVFERDGSATQVSLSIGIASFDGFEEMTAEELLRRADRSLLEAKRRGRGRTVLYAQVRPQESGAAAGESEAGG